MKKTPVVIATLVIPLFAAALLAESCGNGESVGNSPTQGGGNNSSGGSGTGNGNSSGNNSGSGGALITFGSGGATQSQGSGGTTITSSSGGASTSSSGGSTSSTSSGGSNVIIGTSSGGSNVITGGGGTSGGVAGGTDSTFSMDGYGTNATWMGYVFPSAFGTTATINPAKTFTGKQVCAMGTVGADPTYASGAEIGWNIDQAKATTAASPPVLAAPPGGTGLSLMLSGTVTGFRAQIQDAAGTMRWCAPITGNAMQIPWGSFNTMCWDPANPLAAAYNPSTPIASVAVVIPAALTPTTFNFCIVDAKPY